MPTGTPLSIPLVEPWVTEPPAFPNDAPCDNPSPIWLCLPDRSFLTCGRCRWILEEQRVFGDPYPTYLHVSPLPPFVKGHRYGKATKRR